MKRIIIFGVSLAALLIPAAASAYMAPLPKVPLGPYSLISGGRYEQVKPASITIALDGSLYFGGRTGHYATGPDRPNLGHLKWGTYNYNVADATGVEWVRFGHGPLETDAFRIDATVSLHFYDVVNGGFTKLTVASHYNSHVYSHSLVGKTRTLHVTYPTHLPGR
jgi:hypothetical protein